VLQHPSPAARHVGCVVRLRSANASGEKQRSEDQGNDAAPDLDDGFGFVLAGVEANPCRAQMMTRPNVVVNSSPLAM
jgi:hypothetical protein